MPILAPNAAEGASTLYLPRHLVGRSHKLARRARSPGATSVHLVPRAPRWDMCPGEMATTNAR